MIMNREGRPTGDAFVEMATDEDIELALKNDRKNIGKRYVEGKQDICVKSPQLRLTYNSASGLTLTESLKSLFCLTVLLVKSALAYRCLG